MDNNVAEIHCCEEHETHKELQDKINEQMPDTVEIDNLAELFKAFGEPSRLKILFALFGAEVCVCDVAQSLNMTQSAVSHQLKILKQAKLIASRREGKSIFYSLADNHVRTMIAQGREHIQE